MNQEEQHSVQQQQGGLALPDQLRPQRIYLIPVKHRPFMPGLVQPVMLDKERWKATLERVSQTPHQSLGLVYVGEKESGHGYRRRLPRIRLPGQGACPQRRR